ncbi:LacI family DNA-binding transcriptional regulator [Arthrobacter bambusae]
MQESSSVTLADIARLAGVGMATASRALSNSYGVSARTRQRVLAIAEQQHFVVSPQAAGLAKGNTGRVGVLVPHLSRWHFGAVVEGVETLLREAGLDLLLYHVGDAGDRRRFFRALPPRRKVDALIIIGFPVTEDEQRQLELMGVHIVTAALQEGVSPLVHIDDYVAARRAVDHLINLGHRRIAMIEATDPDLPDLSRRRSTAYYDALTEAGLPIVPELVAVADWGGEEGATCMGTLLGLHQTPTAVYAHSDEVALGAMRTIRRAGLRVPQDISVIGIDDHPLASLTDLTTVRQDPFELGRTTAQAVLALLRGEAVPPTTTLPTSLIIRATTAPPIPDLPAPTP